MFFTKNRDIHADVCYLVVKVPVSVITIQNTTSKHKNVTEARILEKILKNIFYFCLSRFCRLSADRIYGGFMDTKKC